jgi:hypothetical protein
MPDGNRPRWIENWGPRAGMQAGPLRRVVRCGLRVGGSKARRGANHSRRACRITASSTTTLLTLVIDGRSYMVSSKHLFSRIVRRPRAPGAALERLAATAAARPRGTRVHAFHLEQLAVLLGQRVLRLDRIRHRRLVEFLERRDHRQAADELGDQAELDQVLRLHVMQHVRRHATVLLLRTSASETDADPSGSAPG